MLADLAVLVDDLVRDAVGRLGEAPRDRAIGLAVVQYGKDRPRIMVTDIAAVAGAPPSLPLPEGWVQGASAVSIEHPIGEVPPRLIGRPAWALMQTPAGPLLGLPERATIGAMFRMTWQLPHQVDDTVDTVPSADREAVAQYAAALLLDQVAALTSGDDDSTIKADAVDHGAAAPNYAERARIARRRYHDLLGIDPKRLKPASVTVQTVLPSTAGQHRLTNWRRR